MSAVAPTISQTSQCQVLKQLSQWSKEQRQSVGVIALKRILKKWLKSTIGVHGNDGHPVITYEDVDTTLIPPRPRLYGLVGGEVIEQVWKERTEKATETATVG